jgi:hypothetical protein
MARNPGRPIITATACIDLALEVDDHYDRLELLKAWANGDWATVKQFMESPE